MKLRDLINSLMEQRGLCNKDVAKGTGYSLAYINDLLKGARRFNEDTERLICEYLGIEKTYVEKTA